MTTLYPIVLETEDNGAVSAYVPGLPVYAAADTHAKAEREIRVVLAAYLDAHPASRPGARVRVARFSDTGKGRSRSWASPRWSARNVPRRRRARRGPTAGSAVVLRRTRLREREHRADVPPVRRPNNGSRSASSNDCAVTTDGGRCVCARTEASSRSWKRHVSTARMDHHVPPGHDARATWFRDLRPSTPTVAS
jgi:predicted RNase H-like HicB family nuclease